MRCARSALQVVHSNVGRRASKYQRNCVGLLKTCRQYSTERPEYIIKSPYADIEIPKISYSDFILNEAAKYKDRTAWVSGFITLHNKTYYEPVQ